MSEDQRPMRRVIPLRKRTEVSSRALSSKTPIFPEGNASPEETWRHLSDTLNNLPVALWAVNQEGLITVLEGNGLEQFGLKSRDHVGQSVFVVFQNDPDMIMNHQRVLTGENFVTSTTAAGDGHFEVRYQTLRDANGHIIGASGVALDMTGRIQAEQALRDVEAHNRALTESVIDAVVSVDSQGVIMGWNRAAEVMFGFSDKEVVGRQIELLVPQRYRELHSRKRSREMVDQRFAGEIRQVIGVRKDGTEFPIEHSISPWETSKGTFFTSVIRDITDRKAEQEQLERRVCELTALNNLLQSHMSDHELTEDTTGQLLGGASDIAKSAKDLVSNLESWRTDLERLLTTFQRMDILAGAKEDTPCAETLSKEADGDEVHH